MRRSMRGGWYERGQLVQLRLLLGQRIEHVGLDRDDVVVVAQITRGGGETKVEAGGQIHTFGNKAVVPVASAVDVGLHGERVVIVTNRQKCVMVEATKLRLTPSQLSVRSI